MSIDMPIDTGARRSIGRHRPPRPRGTRSAQALSLCREASEQLGFEVNPRPRSPHFHAVYGEYQAQIVIATLEPLSGELPPRALRLVREWASLHRSELEANWEKARARQPLATIEPLP